MPQLNFLGQDELAICRLNGWGLGVDFLLCSIQDLLVLLDLSCQWTTLRYFGNGALTLNSTVRSEADHKVGSWPSQGDIVSLGFYLA
jgi:hypothetical protein